MKCLNFFWLSVFNVLLADSIVLPTEKYETMPLPPMTNDLIKKENRRQKQDALSKIEDIFKKNKSVKKSKVKGELVSSRVWDSLKNPQLEKIIRNLLENQYVNLNKLNKKRPL